MNEVILTERSTYDKLVSDIRKCRARIAELTAQRDDLRHHICPALKVRYEEQIGVLEREVLAIQAEVLEKERVIELLIARLNRREQPSVEAARDQARTEFRERWDKIRRDEEEARDYRRRWEEDSRWSHYEQKRRETSSQPSPENITDDDAEADGPEADGPDAGGHEEPEENIPEDPIRELKHLYRKIVKYLHPDERPNATDHEKELLNRAVEAFQTGDLEALRGIWGEIEELEIPVETFDDTEAGLRRLRELLTLLKQRIEALKEEIREIRAAFPYTMKGLLEDADRLAERQKELRELADQLRHLSSQLDASIEALENKLAAENEKRQV